MTGISVSPDRRPGSGIAHRGLSRASLSRAASVEVNGIEPMTSCLQSRRSPN